jgi:pimeloyl-ACP methyl ester carboxylesterase
VLDPTPHGGRRPVPGPRSRRGLRAVAAVVALLLVGACTTGGPTPVAPTVSASATEAPAADLAGYYGQRLTWSGCSSFECAKLRVPVDYADPASGDIELALLRVRASDQGKRLGSLVVNPGGPGGSGVDYAAAADRIVGQSVRRYFDVVGFDPRGVGRSAPIDCLDDSQMDTFLSTDPTPDDAAEQQQLLGEAKRMANACEQKNPTLLPHVSTVDAAKDMDVLRAALGDAQLNYLGKSYGTFLGSTYADLFPKRVGRFVLDGVVPPDLTSAEMGEGQARGFELATRAYVRSCIDDGDCLLGDTVDGGMQWIRDFLARVDRDPLPTGDTAVPELNEAWASLGLGQALYDEGSWGILTDALREASNGNGAGLMALADQYADRDPGGRYTGNLLEVIYAVNCLDRPDSPDLAAYEGYAEEFAKSAPTWGPMLAWGALPCGEWPVTGGTPPHEIHAEGSNTIVVVGTTRDPATIYEWSKRLRDQLADATLLTRDGDGHTAYMRGNSCIDDAIDAYYVQGTAPEDGTTC